MAYDVELMAAAEKATEHAYAPYSGFFVGAALRTASGDMYTGANFENASYGATICAERAAVANAIAREPHHGAGIKIARLAVSVRTRAADRPRTAPPCGICRQVIYEFGPDAVIDFLREGKIVSMSIADLLPEPFTLEPPGE